MKKKSLLVLLMLTSILLSLVSCEKNSDFSKKDDCADNVLRAYILVGDADGNLNANNYYLWDITGGDFQITNFHVTKGQDYALNIGIHHPLSYGEFHFGADRKGSKEVAATFSEVCPPERNTFNKNPDKLNFWIKGDMRLNFRNGKSYTFPNTYIAQGHSGASNNWWFGNDAMTNYSNPILIYNPYSTAGIPIPIYFGQKCFGYISPKEDPNLVFKFFRGEGAQPNPKNSIEIIGVYTKTP